METKAMTERTTDRAIECQSVGTPEVGEGLKTVKLSPWGKVQSTNGDFLVDDEGVREILRTFAEHGTDVPIDVEHSGLDKSLPPMQRGAVGFVKKIFSDVGQGLFSLVQWTDKGRELIRSGQFAYLSPVFLVRKDDRRRVVGLHSAGITNKPAIPRMERLAASQTTEKPMKDETTAHTVDVGDIAELLGVELIPGGADTVVERCHAKLKALLADDAVAIAQSVRTALGLKDDADRDLVVASIGTLKARTADVAALETELATLKVQVQNHELEDWLAPYSAKGVVGWGGNAADKKADREMILRMASSNRADCETVLKQRLSLLPPQGRTTPPTGRQMTIIHAEREYRDNAGHRNATSLKAFVAQSLRDKGLPNLTEAETAELSIA